MGPYDHSMGPWQRELEGGKLNILLLNRVLIYYSKISFFGGLSQSQVIWSHKPHVLLTPNDRA